MEQQQHFWSHLPDLCLLAVFKYIPTSDMIRSVGRVCTNWGRVQKDELKRRSTLVIIGIPLGKNGDEPNDYLLKKVNEFKNPYKINLIEHACHEDGSSWVRVSSLDQIEIDTLRVYDDVLTERNTTSLMDIMPNITHLTVKLSMHSTSPIPALEQMIRLINHYATSLITLKLDFDYVFIGLIVLLNRDLPTDLKTRLCALLGSFNRLESLQHLTINILSFENEYPEWTILSRLNTSTFNESYSGKAPLSENYLRVNSIEWHSAIPLNELTRIDSQLAKKFTRVCMTKNLEDNVVDLNNLRLFCTQFVNLTSLSLGTRSIPMTMLARCLSQLTKLVSLTLWFDYIFEEEQTPQFEITQMSSVRLLTLSISTNSHLNTEQLRVAEIFPNLQIFHLIHDIQDCEECAFDHKYVKDAMRDNEPELYPRISNCMRLARQPFRQCAKLHTVKLDTDLPGFVPQGLVTPDQF